MKISVRNLEPTKVKLTVTVEPEELNPYLDAARKEIAKQVNVPGFRKGHVPGKIIDQRIGFAAVAGEAVNDAVPELYSQGSGREEDSPDGSAGVRRAGRAAGRQRRHQAEVHRDRRASPRHRAAGNRWP